MKPWTNWLDWAIAALGIYMMFVPAFTVDATNGLSSWLAVLLGAWIMMTALFALGYPGAKRLRVGGAVLGVALLLAPWVFGYADSGAAAGNAWAVGAIVTLVSITGQLRLGHMRTGLEARELRLTLEGDVLPATAEARGERDAGRASEPPAEVAEELLTWVASSDAPDATDIESGSRRGGVRTVRPAARSAR